MISAPASANASVMASPMPRVPPVTMATSPARENMEGVGEAILSESRADSRDLSFKDLR